MIDWGDKLKSSKPSMHPSIDEMSTHCEIIYEPIRNEDDISSLNSNVNIPVIELYCTILIAAFKSNDKLYCIILITSFKHNVFDGVPLKLCTSLLAIIPKVGDLRLPTNCRGISMQPFLVNLCDNIITN